MIDGYNRVVDKLCPVMTGAVVLGCFYWSAVTLGGLTVWQVTGWWFFGGPDLSTDFSSFLTLKELNNTNQSLLTALKKLDLFR